ncbi:hypothetical protein ACROYT_G025054 [Oculina patagonica]
MIAKLETKEQEIHTKMEELETKDLYLEAYSRREDNKFTNILEFSSPSRKRQDTEEVLRGFLGEQLGYLQARTVEIQRVHRLGKKYNDGEPRPIDTGEIFEIKPTSNQPAFLYGTAKTHKFQNPEQITKDNLKLRPIVSTCGTFYYETAKFLASYLLPFTENEYSIKTTTDFGERLTSRTVDDDEVLVSYDVSSLFTEVPLDETIDHIIHEIYTNNKLPQLSSKLLFRRLLCNVTKNIQFSVLTTRYINKSMHAA